MSDNNFAMMAYVSLAFEIRASVNFVRVDWKDKTR